jgi:hypothetical protein
MLMTYSTVFMGVFFAVVTPLTLIANRERFRTTLRVLVISGATSIIFYLLMFLFTGFNLLEAAWASIGKDEASMGTGYETFGRYLHLGFANLFAFFIGVGVPMIVLWLRQAIRLIRFPQLRSISDVYVISYVIALFIIAFSTLYTMEVERIWIFMAPFVVIPAAKYLHDRCNQEGNARSFYWVVGLLCVQLVLAEVTLYTYW